ncbi:MAG TPA: phenylalanine--tRNA ligase subunit alpha [Candidatus Saccharimonadales bacterium]|nr:phenylalanine--tRNA ligase subunit alpha [Candidatus Saccharimonadales bacterium]
MKLKAGINVNVQSLNELKRDLLQQLKSISNEVDLETFRLEFLSRQGNIAQLFETLKTLDADQKRLVGPQLNELKKEIQQLFNETKEKLFQEKLHGQEEKQKYFDVTISKPTLKGSLHPYTQITEQIQNIFISMGYSVVDGPELETEFFNFTALNVPANHPARQDSDTFWIDNQHLLRTQTSTVQIRTMQTQKPPIAIIAPGRTMRNEATDASHDFMFMQFEGMYIAENVSISNLLATLKSFLTQLFEKEITIRVRPGYFPFVEPGLEIDASCPFCLKGCSVCKRTGWIELMGAGLIHPEVLKHGGIDPTKYSGFAFGFGLTRLTMLKYQIPDIRLLHSSNIQFLQQF